MLTFFLRLDPLTLFLLMLAVAALIAVPLSILLGGSRGGKNKRIKSVLSRHRSELGRQYVAEHAPKGTSLRPRSKGGAAETIQKLLEKFNMQDLLQSQKLKKDLSMAGIRGRQAIVFYVAARFATAVGGYFVALLLIGLWQKFPYPDFVRFIFAGAGVFVGFYLPKVFLTNIIQKRQSEMTDVFPDVLDLLVICVESGLGIEQAFARVTEEIMENSPVLAQELGLTSAELAYLGDRRVAYENFAKRTGLAEAKSLATTLIQSEQYGTPVGVALQVLSQEKRDERMSRAERKAAALPAKLTVPMIIFFLPVLFMVVIGPAILQINMR